MHSATLDHHADAIAWADLLRRIFEIDVLACGCGGRLRFIATAVGSPARREWR